MGVIHDIASTAKEEQLRELLVCCPVYVVLVRIHGQLSPRCSLPKVIGEQEITGLPGPLIKSRGKICAETY